MSRRSCEPAWIAPVLLALACASGGGGEDRAPEPVPTSWVAAPTPTSTVDSEAGFFSVAQVERGRDLFASICSDCHYASEVSDRTFRFSWRRRTVGDLFELVSETMPDDDPGALEAGQYADVVAYILSLNGFEPGGEEMPADAAALELHSLARLSN